MLIHIKLLFKHRLSIAQTAQIIAGHKVKHQHMGQSISPFVRGTPTKRERQDTDHGAAAQRACITTHHSSYHTKAGMHWLRQAGMAAAIQT